jgi:hypothetical protein
MFGALPRRGSSSKTTSSMIVGHQRPKRGSVAAINAIDETDHRGNWRQHLACHDRNLAEDWPGGTCCDQLRSAAPAHNELTAHPLFGMTSGNDL